MKRTPLLAAVCGITLMTIAAGGLGDKDAPIFGIKSSARISRLDFVAGQPTNVQFMVKDSTKHAATGGWGFGQFKNGKPDDMADLKTYFPCQEPIKARDFVFTQTATTP